MAKYQVDFSGARNIIDPLEGVRNSLQQTGATLGQMIGQDEQRAERLRDEAYRRDALALQQTAAKRDTDKYNQELADRTFAQKTFAAYNQAPTRDYSALPTQLTDTEKGKSVINDMSLTAEELANPTMPSAIAKMKNQQILSDVHDKSGQTLLESEKFKAAMASTAKGTDGMIPLSMQEKLLGMESAERAAMAAKSERDQKVVETLSKDRSELQRAGLKDATTLAAAEIRAAEGKGGSSKNDSKDGGIPKWQDYDKLETGLKEKYSFTPWGDAKNITAVMDRASAVGMKPDELSGLISKHTIRGLVDNTFDTEKVLADINAKKPVLTGADNGSTTRTPGRFASLDPMAGYGELLKQKDAAYRQALANTANIPLTQADVLAARSAKGATQLDELIAKLGTTAGKTEVQPEVKNTAVMPSPEIKKDESKTTKNEASGAKKEFDVNELFANVSNKKEANNKTKTLMDVLGIPQTNVPTGQASNKSAQTPLVNPSWSEKSAMAKQIMEDQNLSWEKSWAQVEQKVRDAQVVTGVSAAAKELAQKEGIPYELAVQKLTDLTNMRNPSTTLQTTASPIMRQGR